MEGNHKIIEQEMEKLQKHSDQDKSGQLRDREWFKIFKNNIRGNKDVSMFQLNDLFPEPEELMKISDRGPALEEKIIGNNKIIVFEKKVKKTKTNKIIGCIRCCFGGQCVHWEKI